MHIKASDGTHLHVKDIGEGKPVILIHGWPLTGDMFEYQSLALIEAGYRVITYDRRGFGLSGHPASGYDYDRFADDLSDVIGALEIERVSLVGFSMGGGEIARYLSRHGASKIDRVALVSAVTPYLAKHESNPDGVDPTVFEDMKDKVREDRFAFLQSFAKQFYGVGLISHPVSSALMDWTFSLATMASPKATIDCIDAFGYTDFRNDMASFTVPTLIIHGTSDAVVPIETAGRAAADALPHATFIEYDGEPHGLHATVPRRLNGDLIAFLSGADVPNRHQRFDEAVDEIGGDPIATTVAAYP